MLINLDHFVDLFGIFVLNPSANLNILLICEKQHLSYFIPHLFLFFFLTSAVGVNKK